MNATPPAALPLPRPWPFQDSRGLVFLLPALTAVYFVLGKLGLSLAFFHSSASPVWPPTGFALAAMVVWGYRIWPAVLIGAFLVNITTEGNVPTCLGIAAGNTLEAVVGTWMFFHFAGGADCFKSPQRVGRYMASVAAGSTLLSALAGTLSLALGGYAEWERLPVIAFTWWVGNGVSNMVLAPLLLVLALDPRFRVVRSRAAEGLLLLVLLALASGAVFGRLNPTPESPYPIEYLLIPFLLWACFRFGQTWALLGTFLVAVIAIQGTLAGYGPFHSENTNRSLLLLQIFLAIITTTTLLLSSVLEQQRRSEAELVGARREAEEAVRAKDQFLAMLSHELRTPLTPILMATDILKHRAGASDIDHRLTSMIERNIHLQARLIDDLLDLNRIRYGKVELQLEPVRLHQRIQRALDICSAEIGEKRLEVTTELKASNDELLADSARLEQVLWNLLKNAAKFTPPEGKLRIRTADTPEGGLLLEVEDSGEGIPAEVLPRLFSPFVQGGPADSRGGLGLGLAICKAIIDAHGGEIRAESEGIQKGARFEIRLPRRPHAWGGHPLPGVGETLVRIEPGRRHAAGTGEPLETAL